VTPPQRDPKILGRKTSGTTRPGESRQDLRTAATREALLAAAFKIFVRDGFEASRIEDIAAEAGRSRGSFYVNFRNKTEAFLALRKQQALAFEARLRKQLHGQTTREKQRQAMEEIMVEITLEKSYILLLLEFKLFATRHPRLLKRISQNHFETGTTTELRDLFFDGEAGTLMMQQRSLALEAILEGFTLNFSFSSEVMTGEYIQKWMPLLTRIVIDPSN
jgi:AcrR family transcriptional regulator